MQSKIERLIGEVYKRWKASSRQEQAVHIDEEDMACFAEGRLAKDEEEKVKSHLVICPLCAESLAVRLSLKEEGNLIPRPELIAQAKEAALPSGVAAALEIVLKLKEKALQILSTSGDILLGRELVPAPVLRSRKITDFKDELTILKDFAGIRIEAKIENRQGKSFDLTVISREKSTSRVIRDLRVTLIKEGRELASCLTDSGAVTFENILLGSYSVEVSSPDKKLAAILLEIKS